MTGVCQPRAGPDTGFAHAAATRKPDVTSHTGR